MSDLVEFLKARLDADEQAARATTGPWKYHRETDGVVLPTAGHVPELREIVSTPREPADAVHMVRWHSDRVLAEVEAKRRIMTRHHDFRGWCDGCGNDLTYRISECPELRDLASVYADHPDYRQEWRP